MADLMDAPQVWDTFLNGFGLVAYDENTVPEDAEMPRMTYGWAEGEMDAPVLLSASLWYRSQSWAAITQKAAEIYDAIGIGGVLLTVPGGYIWATRGAPFSQRMADEDDGIRRIVLNFNVEFLRA